MIKGLLLALLMVPSIASAVELKFGLAYAAAPLYNGTYEYRGYDYEYSDNRVVGKIELSHHFAIDENVGINVYGTHYSLLAYPDPHYGINLLGAEIEFKFTK